ncbi:MAG: alpha/beta fold hydrolase [Clostridiales bacterium]|nr:alpha/beta fold hydrolase [Clostridiales bacterium]
MKKSILIVLSIMMISVFTLSGCSNNTVAPTEEELSKDAYAFVEKLSVKDYSGAKSDHKFDIVMNLLTGKKTLQSIWEALITEYGEYYDIYGYERSKASGFDNIIVKVAFTNKCIDLKVTYKEDTLKISGLHYTTNADKPVLAGAPTIVLPDGIVEQTFSFGISNLELPAILTTPEKGDKFPVVILVHGSGPNNSDESVGNQFPFRDIAWGLAQQGIAVIRYDKRTLVYPESFTDTSTVEDETVEDAMMAAITMQTIPEIDASKIFILGHSLGGMMIPRIAELTPEAKGYIMMGAAVTPLHKLIIEQYEYIFNLDGKLSISERITLWQSKRMSNNVEELVENSKIESKDLFNISPAYWLHLQQYDMLSMLNDFAKPLLVLQGESDYQVPMRDFEMIKQALSGKDNAQTISYPGLGHLMTTAGTPPAPDDYYNELQVDQSVIDDIASFISNN